MPGKNGTEPLGNGLYTGRRGLRRFPCYNNNGFNSNFGRGFGRRCFSVHAHKDVLKSQRLILENRIKSINSQLENN